MWLFAQKFSIKKARLFLWSKTGYTSIWFLSNHLILDRPLPTQQRRSFSILAAGHRRAVWPEAVVGALCDFKLELLMLTALLTFARPTWDLKLEQSRTNTLGPKKQSERGKNNTFISSKMSTIMDLSSLWIKMIYIFLTFHLVLTKMQ